MENFNDISGFSSNEYIEPTRTQQNIPVNQNDNTDTTIISFPNILNNHDKLYQKEKENENEKNYFSVKRETSTKKYTNEIQIPQPKIFYVVGMANLGTPLRLREIALQCRNSAYNPKKLNAVFMEIKEPKTVAFILSSGDIVTIGTTNERDLEKATSKFAKNIKKIGYNVELKDFRITNFVATCYLKFPLKLTLLSLKLNSKSDDSYSLKNKKEKNKIKCHYEPELFPCLIYYMRKPEITLVIFKTGKIIFAGAKKRNDIYYAFKKVYPILYTYKDEPFIKNNKIEDKNVSEFSYINNK